MQDFSHQIMDEDYKKELLDILYTKSFRYDEAGFTLTSGKKSNYYIDVKKTALSSVAMELIGYAYFIKLKLAPVDAIGGMTLGADPIAYSAALMCTLKGKYLDVFIIRKEAKGHGTQAWIEGDVKPDANVVVVEDVITTGGSTIKAVQKAKEAGFNVLRVVAFLDREEGGAENIEKETGVKVDSIFTMSDLLEVHKKKQEEEEKEKKKQQALKEKPVF
ncbi:MAG: orotate phosphoribosyltransferase [Deltaproteobacteria bacterium GWA2_55_10]|nr:MAG: orotate phosphoribosyltransferase [Deltaproteobacteria bacterium GWA2_55_10]